MKREFSETIVALYWDFENIHASVFDSIYGPRAYSTIRAKPQENVVNVRTIIDYASTIGVVAINKAYANWQGFARYRDVLNQNGLDLIQHFPRGMKNGADIRLALDVIEDIHHFPYITHIIVVGSDSDYISLAQKIKQSGRTIIGIGVQENANPYWVQCCNEFKFYKTLLNKVDASQISVAQQIGEAVNIEDARELMLRSLRSLVAQRGENVVPRSSLKVLMLRDDPSFDEANYNFGSFSTFIDAFPDIVQNIHNDSGGFVRLLETKNIAAPASNHTSTLGRGVTIEETYLSILKKGNIRPIPVAWWRKALYHIEIMFFEAENKQMASFDVFRIKLADRLGRFGIDNDASLINKLRTNLYALHQFILLGDNIGIKLKIEPNSQGGELIRRVEEELVRRLVTYATPPIDAAAVARIVCGETNAESIERANTLIENFLNAQKESQLAVS